MLWLYIGMLRIHSNKSSRHMIVCRAAQEAGTSHRGYIDRKKVLGAICEFAQFINCAAHFVNS